MTSADHGRTARTVVGIACLLNGIVMLVFGVWALVLPASFAAWRDSDYAERNAGPFVTPCPPSPSPFGRGLG